MSAIKFTFALRRKILALIVRSVAGNIGVNELAKRIEKAKSETACIDLLQNFVTANSSGIIDEYFGVDRFDYTKKEKPAAAINAANSRPEKTARDETSQEDFIPRPKYRRTHQHPFKSGESFYEQVQFTLGNTQKKDHPIVSASAGGGPTLSQKLSVSSNVLQERRQANLCLKCGAPGNKVAQCPQMPNVKAKGVLEKKSQDNSKRQ
ncbi:hypothetical protein Pmar_PMAR010992, partial [Perkinsus marinus ATCC 50983]